jgi:hypothetical protein
MEMQHLSEILSLGAALLTFAFGYGKVSARLSEAERRARETEEFVSTNIAIVRDDMQRDITRIREEILRENRHIDGKFQGLDAQIVKLRTDVFQMRDKLNEEMSEVLKLLFEIKGRLEERR